MEIKELKVPIEQESIEYLQEVFKDYKEVNKPIYDIKGRCIINIIYHYIYLILRLLRCSIM